jgi:hypothetical protein
MTAVYENTPAPVKYFEPKACVKARREKLSPYHQAALSELIDRYRKAADERPVTITVRQIVQFTGMSRAKAARVVLELIEFGFLKVVSKGSIEEHGRRPSRYRLTMFPCNGEDATHDYIEDPKAWRRQRRSKKLGDEPKEPTVTVKLPLSTLAKVLEVETSQSL